MINGDGSTLEFDGDTLDYLTFEVRSAGTITTTIEWGSSRQLWLGRYIGLENEFEYLLTREGEFLNPYSIVHTGGPPPSLSVFLQPGIYVGGIFLSVRMLEFRRSG